MFLGFFTAFLHIYIYGVTRVFSVVFNFFSFLNKVICHFDTSDSVLGEIVQCLIFVFTGFSDHVGEQLDEIADDILEFTDFATSVDSGSKTYVSSDKDFGIDDGDLTSGPWSCKGGDWRRNDESSQERNARKKLVLNDGFPLCQMSKSGYEDPRWHQKDELYYPSQSRRLDLPPWAFTCLDDRPTLTVRGTKGTMLPVIRINACVVKDHGSFVSEPRMKVRGKGHSRSRLWSSNSDGKRSADGDFHLKIARDVSLERSLKTTGLVSIPKDRLCSYDDLQLHLGVWYYLDGAGHECGPSSFSELQLLVDQGVIQKNSSVFRKFDRVWVPVTSFAECSELTKNTQREKTPLLGETTKNSVSVSGTNSFGGLVKDSNAFHELHPQFIGYTRGKLHELVMKFYKSREFAAAINDVLDPWINAKQPKKEMEKTMHWKSGIGEVIFEFEGILSFHFQNAVGLSTSSFLSICLMNGVGLSRID